MDRIDLLEKLINFEAKTNSITDELKQFPWDSEKPLVYITQKNIIKLINLFLDDKISHSELVEWANAIECREDIGFEGKEEIFLDLISEIATPEINPPFTKEYAKKVLSELCDFD